MVNDKVREIGTLTAMGAPAGIAPCHAARRVIGWSGPAPASRSDGRLVWLDRWAIIKLIPTSIS